MAGIVLKNICKIYPSRDKKHKEGVKAVDNFNMEIENNEFIVFVGPSGCGKSTTLRMIAGLEEISSGELYIDGQYMNETEPKNRDIAMVFQNYALYPHMTAYKNIAFGLTLRKHPFPVYIECDEVSALLKSIADNENLIESCNKSVISLRTANEKIIKGNNKTVLAVEELEEEIQNDIYKNVHNTKAQKVLKGLLAKKESLETVLSSANETISNNLKEIEKLEIKSTEADTDINKAKEELKQYQLFEIDYKKIKKYEKELKYYEKVEAKDDAKVQSIGPKLEALKAEVARLNETLSSDKYKNLDDEKIQNEYYKLEVAKLKKEKDIAFYNEELEIFEARKQSIASGKSTTEKHLEVFRTQEQPVFKYRKFTKQEIDQRVMKAAAILDIEPLLQRKPREMSGGQRQRIALGRAIVRQPKVFLLDEPLSNLDAKLRANMRVEITKLHKELGTTFIYVTHDQVEAMTMGTRIAVMKNGVTQQIDTPSNLFDYPINKFVAGFIGTPQMNFFDVEMKSVADSVEFKFLDGTTISYKASSLRKIHDEYLDGEYHKVTLGIRGEKVSLSDEGIPMTIKLVEALGSTSNVYCTYEGAADKEYISVENGRVSFESGSKVKLQLEPSAIHLFDEVTTLSIMDK